MPERLTELSSDTSLNLPVGLRRGRRSFLKTSLVATLACSGILTFSPSYANAAVNVGHKLNIAADLRMFTQRMALSAAFVLMDVEKAHFLEVLSEEFSEFEADIDMLRNGDASHSMDPETNKLVLEAINTVEFGWKVLGPALKGVIDTGAVSEEQFNKIEKVNTQVMTLADSLVHRIMLEYKDDIPQELVYRIDIVGAQRMLSQKMIKEAVLIALEFEPEAHHEMLLGSEQLFQFGLDKLSGKMVHNEVMLPSVTGALAQSLSEAENHWALVKPLLDKLDKTHEVTDADALELAKESDEMLEIFDSMFNVLIDEAERL